MQLVLLSIIITLIFFISGFKKLSGIGTMAESLYKSFPIKMIPLSIFTVLIFVVALLEIVMPPIIVYAAIDRRYYFYGYLAAMALGIFTILTTFLYYFPPLPFYSSKYMSFMLHLSLIGGLFLLVYVFMYC